jgi:DNA-binding transcriptional LysR family regulator
MALEPWDELRTALHVARAGTVSGAAASLGVHHATVIRHIDALEDRISVRLFQRHAKGYTPTEAGRALFETAAETEKRFEQLATRLKNMQEGVRGQVIITTIPELSILLLPVLADLVAQHPELKPCLRTEARILRLEYGEAHLALRAGPQPQEPDNVVQSLGVLAVALYASPAYLQTHDLQEGTEENLKRQRFVGTSDPESRAPHDLWLRSFDADFALCSNDWGLRLAAIKAGVGIGFLPVAQGVAEGLHVVTPPRREWQSTLWLVTHVDLHRSPKVQSCAKLLRAHFARMNTDHDGAAPG